MNAIMQAPAMLGQGEAYPIVDTANTPAYVLPMLSDYLLESVFEAYRATVSSECSRSVDALALCVYASYFIPLPLRVEAWTGDRPASILVRLASMLMPSATLSLSASANLGNIQVLRVSTNDVDKQIDVLIDMQLLPNRSRMDVGYMRRRLAASARQWHDRVMNVGVTPRVIVQTISDLAGDRWPSVAARVIGG